VRAAVGIIIFRGVVLKVFLEGLYVGMTGLGAAGPMSIEQTELLIVGSSRKLYQEVTISLGAK
jgi:hypothetical protein